MSNLFTESLFCKWTQTCHFKIKFWAFYETWIRWDNQIFVHKEFLINWWSHLAARSEGVSVSRRNSYWMSFSVKRVSIPRKLIYFPNILIFLVASCHWQPEIDGHACPRLFENVLSVSAIQNFVLSVSASMSAVSKFVISVSADIGGRAFPRTRVSVSTDLCWQLRKISGKVIQLLLLAWTSFQEIGLYDTVWFKPRHSQAIGSEPR